MIIAEPGQAKTKRRLSQSRKVRQKNFESFLLKQIAFLCDRACARVLETAGYTSVWPSSWPLREIFIPF
jgi:hypothetical protein